MESNMDLKFLIFLETSCAFSLSLTMLLQGQGGKPKVVPPLLAKGTLSPETGRFWIESGISSDMVITDRNSLWGGSFKDFWPCGPERLSRVLKMG